MITFTRSRALNGLKSKGTNTPISDILNRKKVISNIRQGEYIHVSDLINNCIRYRALLTQTDEKPKPFRVSHSMGLTWAFGLAAEKYVVDTVLSLKKDEVRAVWSCKCKAVSVCGVWRNVKPKKCTRCNSLTLEYNQLVLRDEELGLTGSPDLLINTDRGEVLTEIKSIKRKSTNSAYPSWDSITTPVPIHLIQNLFYWKFAKDAGIKVSDKISFIYVCKEFIVKQSPFKEFYVDANKYIKRLNPYINLQKQYVQFKQGGALPDRHIKCKSITDAQAKQCHLAKVCFSHD